MNKIGEIYDPKSNSPRPTVKFPQITGNNRSNRTKPPVPVPSTAGSCPVTTPIPRTDLEWTPNNYWLEVGLFDERVELGLRGGFAPLGGGLLIAQAGDIGLLLR